MTNSPFSAKTTITCRSQLGFFRDSIRFRGGEVRQRKTDEST